MQEIEVLRLTEAAFLKWFSNRFVIVISSTEVLDAIFEECNVSISDRIPLLKVLQEVNGMTNIKDIKANY